MTEMFKRMPSAVSVSSTCRMHCGTQDWSVERREYVERIDEFTSTRKDNEWKSGDQAA